MPLLKAGTPAPDFTLPATPGKNLSLSDFRGKNLVMVFYPADWSPVCTDQLAIYTQALPILQSHNAEIVGISVDGAWCHQAFRNDRDYSFPLLADFEPKGAVSRAYGAYREGDGVSERALFVVDGEGIIRWSHLSPPEVNPGAEGIFDALEAIESAHAAAP